MESLWTKPLESWCIGVCSLFFSSSCLYPFNPVTQMWINSNLMVMVFVRGKHIMLDPAAWDRQSCCCSVVPGPAVGSAPAGTWSTHINTAPRGLIQAPLWLSRTRFAGGNTLHGHTCLCKVDLCSRWAQSPRLPGSCPWHVAVEPLGLQPHSWLVRTVAHLCLHTHSSRYILSMWRNSCVVARYCGFGLHRRESVLLASLAFVCVPKACAFDCCQMGWGAKWTFSLT